MTTIDKLTATLESLETATHYTILGEEPSPIVDRERNCVGCNGVTMIRTAGGGFSTFTILHMPCLKKAGFMKKFNEGAR